MRSECTDRGTDHDTRHNKDHDNLKSSLKTGAKPKTHRVVFDESANEFFEADYIIVVRDECGYSDEGESDECSGCGGCERYQEPDLRALSPPEGYKDLGLFNRDGTLREQAWLEAGDVVLVGERSGTVFTPQHLQLLRRLQRERMLRSTMCADCNTHANVHQPHGDGFAEVEDGYEDEETSDAEQEKQPQPLARRIGKHIAAGEERPRISSSQQTTPADDCLPELITDGKRPGVLAAPPTSEDSDTADTDGFLSSESSPLSQRKGGILKGGRLWKSVNGDNIEQNDDQRSTSDEDGSGLPRSVRFVDRPTDLHIDAKHVANKHSDSETITHKEHYSIRNDAPIILSLQRPKSSSAVQQLFNSERPPPPTIEPQLVTSETLRAWDAGVRPRTEEAAVRRASERNALRCSLLRSEARKSQPPKQDTIPLAERIRLLTYDVDDQDVMEEQRAPPAGTSASKFSSSLNKSYSREKAFGTASSSSSSSTTSAPVPACRQSLELGDGHQEVQKSRRLLSTLAPLTACVGHASRHDNFYYAAPEDKTSPSAASTYFEMQDFNETPAPDVVAGTPGSCDGDDGMAAYVRAAPRSVSTRQRHNQETQSDNNDDEHDDYGFHRRPTVQGIVTTQQLDTSEDNVRQMHSELQPTVSAEQPPAYACHSHRASANSNYAYVQYYAEQKSRPHSSASTNSNWCSDSSQELYSSQTSSEQTSPMHPQRDRRPESPPPIRSLSQLLYVPYVNHSRYQHLAEYAQHWTAADYRCMQQYQQQQRSSGATTPQPAQTQRASAPVPQYAHAYQLQTMCPASVRYRTVPASQPGAGKQMICISEKVVAPLYQPAPGSPSRLARGTPQPAPTGTPNPSATSPLVPPRKPVYYAMNV